jgi:hypothetical protein
MYELMRCLVVKWEYRHQWSTRTVGCGHRDTQPVDLPRQMTFVLMAAATPAPVGRPPYGVPLMSLISPSTEDRSWVGAVAGGGGAAQWAGCGAMGRMRCDALEATVASRDKC